MRPHRYFALFTLLTVFFLTDLLPAQQPDVIMSSMKRLAGMLRLKSKIIRLKEPVLYLGFHNQDPMLQELEEQIEEEFLRKFTGIVVCSVHEQAESSERLDQSEADLSSLSAKELQEIVQAEEDITYILLGSMDKNPETGNLELSVNLFHLAEDVSLASTKTEFTLN